MPSTRRSARLAADSSLDDLSMIGSAKVQRYTELSEPLKEASSPLKRAKTPLKNRRTKSRPATPKFDPDVHGLELDYTEDSDDDFEKSVTYSARDRQAQNNDQEAEMVVDYDSDLDGSFSFSPVKWSGLAASKPFMQSTPLHPRKAEARYTPIPSATRRIEVRISSLNAPQIVNDGVTRHPSEDVSDVQNTSIVSRRRRSRRSSIKSSPMHPARLQAEQDVVSRSPRVRLTRAMPGQQSLVTLETLEVPDFNAEDEEIKRRQAGPRKPFARLPKRKVTVGRAPSFCTTSSGTAPEQAPNDDPDMAEMPILVAKPRKPKRKMSRESADVVAQPSPAKRARMNDTAPIYNAKQVSLGTSSPTKFARLHTNLSKARRVSRLTTRDPVNNGPAAKPPNKLMPHIVPGLVPSTLYSPAKIQPTQPPSSITKPKPFVFATDERLNRTTIPKETKKLPQITSYSIEKLPFIPRPSQALSTLPNGPDRQLPSRLELRREFDKVANQHADAMLTRRKEAEAEMAAERERRMDARKGYDDAGRAKIEEWHRQRLISDGKRVWID